MIKKINTENCQRGLPTHKLREHNYNEEEILIPTTVDEMADALEEYCGISDETIQVVSKLLGYSTDTMLQILEVVAGYSNFEQLIDEYHQ